jgi:hypothetical protein
MPDELCQFILHCSCGRFKAKCRMPYHSFAEEVRRELMLRVWQHGEALPAAHPAFTWAGVEALAVDCWSDNWAHQFVVPSTTPPAAMEEGLVVLRRREEPSRSRSRSPACRQPRSPSTPPPTQLLTTQGSLAARDEISQVLEAVDDTIEVMWGVRKSLREIVGGRRESRRRG